MRLNLASKLLVFSSAVLGLWWISIQMLGTKDAPINFWFTFAYGLPPLFGGVYGLLLSKKWGLMSSSMGRALFFLSLGLVAWGLGEMVWAFYILVLQIEIPYPSLADAFFILSWPLWSVGVVNLSKATGAKFSLKNKAGKLILLIVPIVVIIASYYLLFVVARQSTIDTEGGFLKLFVDLIYPIWDVVLLTLVLLVYGLSLGFLGGKFRLSITLIVLGFVFNYFADMGLSYTSTIGTFYNGGFVDLLFTIAMVLLPLGVSMLDVDTIRSSK